MTEHSSSKMVFGIVLLLAGLGMAAFGITLIPKTPLLLGVLTVATLTVGTWLIGTAEGGRPA